MDFKQIYSLARKVPHLEGLTEREVTLYRNAWRNGYRAKSNQRCKISKK